MDDDTLRSMQEQSHMLDELTRHPGWQVLVDLMHHEMAGPKFALLNGTIDSIDRYKFQTGELRGIHRVLDAPESVQKVVDAELARRRELAVFERES